MKTWAQAEGLVAVDLPGAVWPMVEDSLRTVARDYFGRTLAWRSTLDPQLSAVGVWEYDAVEETGAEPVKILAATYDKSTLRPLTTREFMLERAQVAGNGNPEFLSYNGESLLLWPPAMVAGRQIWVEAAFRPSLASKGLPDEVWSEHIDALIEGVKAKLKLMKDMPFTDYDGARVAAANYRDAIGSAGVAATKGYTRARTNSTARFF